MQSCQPRNALSFITSTRTEDERFIVPLPKQPDSGTLGESRSQAVRRFLSLERSLRAKGQFQELETTMQEYFDIGHAEPVPEADMYKPPESVFYLPMHTVRKESSTTTRVSAVFDASAKLSSGISLNETLLVGPTAWLVPYLWRISFLFCCQHVREIDSVMKYPRQCNLESFYVDDGLTRADTLNEAIKLQGELQDLFEKGGFLLRKWKDPDVLQGISPEL